MTARGWDTWGRAIVPLVCAVAVGLELYLVFVNRHGEFRIEGKQVYELAEFGSGAVVSHAFLMRGDGLNQVSLRFVSNVHADVTVAWTLWRGFDDEPLEKTRAFEGTESVALSPGRQWKSFSLARDASSRERWYTFEVRSLAVMPAAPDGSQPPAEPPRVALVASRDNPERGGVLWVDGVRQPGSLAIRAEREGRTIYRRFVAEVEPNMPSLLRVRAVQWAVAIAFHWAFAVLAWAVLSEAGRWGQVRRPLL